MRVLTHFLLWQVGLRNASTRVSDEETAALLRHARGRARLVEIGVFHGVTTSRLRSVMAADGVLYAVDPFPAGRLGFSMQRCIAQREVAKLSNGTVRWIRAAGVEAAPIFFGAESASADFVFVDADNTFEGFGAIWAAWSRLVREGGVIALNNSHPTSARPMNGAGSVRFTREVVLADPRFRVVEVVETVTFLERPLTS